VNFRAKLRRSSPIYKHWTGSAKIGGTINGVTFKKDGPRDFVSVDDPLPPGAVAALLNHQHVELEMTTEPTGGIAVIDGIALGDEDQGEEPTQPEDVFAANYVPPTSVRDDKAEPLMRRPVGRPPKNR
jgi:hypothetical protein